MLEFEFVIVAENQDFPQRWEAMPQFIGNANF